MPKNGHAICFFTTIHGQLTIREAILPIERLVPIRNHMLTMRISAFIDGGVTFISHTIDNTIFQENS